MKTNDIYIIAGALVFLIFVLCIVYLIWYFQWKKKQGFIRLPDQENHIIQQRTPKIKLNTVEFSLPDKNQKWTDSKDDFEYHIDEFRKREYTVDNTRTITFPSKDMTKKESGVRTTMGLLKPELYMNNDEQDVDYSDDLPPGNIGRVWFSLEYDVQSEKLIVLVDRIKNLPGRQQRSSISLSSNSSCDPFIRLYLLPDEKRYLQSKMKRKSTNPVFKETFMFTMSYNLLIERTLRITVFDVDRFMRQTVIGHVLVPLQGLDITVVAELWKDLEKSSQICNDCGRLQLGLTYFPALNRVAVNIVRGQSIGSDDIAMPDCYVKVTYSILNKVHKIKKTAVQKASSEPFFNQTIEFKIDQEGMDTACINFEVFHNTTSMKNDKPLGSFIVGGALCARGKELEHWANMILKPQTLIKEWHDLKS